MRLWLWLWIALVVLASPISAGQPATVEPAGRSEPSEKTEKPENPETGEAQAALAGTVGELGPEDAAARWGTDLPAEPAGARGIVADLSSRPLAGVEVEIRTAGGAFVAQAVTDAQGRFRTGAVAAGTYKLTAVRAGFKPAVLDLVLPPAAGRTLAITLAPGFSETVVVQAPPPDGPGVSASGANDYAVGAAQIAGMPAGTGTPLTDVLTRMPGVAIDQNQQIHIRNTEGPQFQYQINGVLVPLDINTNPPFLSMINPAFIQQLDLLTGILPARYSYATGGVVDIMTKDGCSQPGGSVALLLGQRETVQPSVQYGGCSGKLSYYVSSLYAHDNTAFSSATPGPTPVHDLGDQGQAFSLLTYQLAPGTMLSLVASAAASNNQLPNVPNLPPAFGLAGAGALRSADINSDLDFRDDLASIALRGGIGQDLTYQVAYTFHSIDQRFKPDDAGELVFQGVASTASHADTDNTLEGDLTYRVGRHTLGTGFYLGAYRVTATDSSLVFPVDAAGNQAGDVPIHIGDRIAATNVLSGIYLDDLWQIGDRWRANLGLRWDDLTGFTDRNQLDPTINLSFLPTPRTTWHAGFARFMQVPSFLGIPPNASTVFAGTTAAGPPGISNPLTEDDYEWDAGVVHHLTSHLTVSLDGYYEDTHRYLDTGQFGVVPIFAPFNYGHGSIWGGELAVGYRDERLTAYTNVTFGRNSQIGVVTGQFNFDPDELAFIETHHIPLDHQPLVGTAAGATWSWRPYSFGLDAIYSSGLAGGFADQETLPAVVQINANAERGFRIPGLGQVTDRLILLNILDRVNLIRPAEGIGIFQSAYGPRFTIMNLLTIPLI